MLREAVADDTALGRQAAPIMAAGGLVPDDLMIGIINDRMGKPDAERGFILDGFPRTTVQAEKLDNIVGNGSDPLRVLQLLVPDDVLVKRTVLRRSCPECGAIYHLESAPPKNDMVCDRDGAPLIHRPDDNEEAVRKRLEAFHRQTLPVATYYQAKDTLRPVDAVRTCHEAFARTEKP